MSRRLIVLTVFVALLSLAVVYGSAFTGTIDSDTYSWQEIGTVLEVMALVKTRHYFQPVSTIDLVKGYVATGTINGMLSQAINDPYTRHMSPAAYDNMMKDTTGIYGGIGIYVGMREEGLTVVSPIKGTPAERAGLRREDLIVEINGKDATFMTLDEAVSIMRGEENTPVDLKLQRDDTFYEVSIIRELINVDSVDEVQMIDEEYHIGYAHITNFSDRTYTELVEALQMLDNEGMKAFVLDLRHNPGGTLSASLLVANEFVSGAPLLYLEDKDAHRTPFDSTMDGTRPLMPMVVLINGGSASASEIVAGALQDNKLATLVGTTTFGKGLVQSLYPLRDGSAISITEQGYLTSGGFDINGVGIEPDIVVEISLEEEEAIYLGEAEYDAQLDKGLAVLRAQL